MSNETSDNMVRIRNNTFLVRTQAGFRKAFKRFADDAIPSEVIGYPKTYPSLVFFNFSRGRVNATCISISKLDEIVTAENIRNDKSTKQTGIDHGQAGNT